eukprot:scaffold503289_cov14-Prasinocladus_malaysianus.AAC.1
MVLICLADKSQTALLRQEQQCPRIHAMSVAHIAGEAEGRPQAKPGHRSGDSRPYFQCSVMHSGKILTIAAAS